MNESKWYSSSVDSSKISLTLKSLVPLILAVSALLKLDLTEGYLDQMIEAIIAIISGGYVFYGLIRKFKVRNEAKSLNEKGDL